MTGNRDDFENEVHYRGTMSNESMMFRAVSTLFLSMALACGAYAADYASCGGHWYYKNTQTPMFDGGSPPVRVNQDGQWVTIHSSCDDELHPATDVGAYTAAFRMWLELKAATVPVGTTYEIEVATTKAGVATVQQVLSRKIRASVGQYRPQGDYFGSLLTNLNGANGFRVRMRILGTSTAYIDVNQIFATAQGSRSSYGSARSTAAGTMTVDTTWRIIGSVNVNNTSGADVDVQLQGSITIHSGTPGQRISLGFGKGTASSGNHYSYVYVPNTLPESVTAFDFMPNEGVGNALIPPGSTTINVWAKVDSGSITISDRRIEALGMTAPPTDTARLFSAAEGPTIARTDSTDAQPQSCHMLHASSPDGLACNQSATLPQTFSTPCGKWTKLLEMTLPPNPKWTTSVGGGYIEILNKGCPSGTTCWNDTSSAWAQVAIEFVTNGPSGTRYATDAHMTSFSMANAPTHLYFFEDVFRWGNSDGNIVRLWIRIIDYPCATNYNSEPRQITVGRRYLGVRLFEGTGDLYYPF